VPSWSVHLKSGQTGYFSIDGFSEGQLRGKISPWINAMAIVLGAPAQSAMGSFLGAAPAGESLSSVADELTKLASLRDQGILTEEEFSAQKAKLLA
jgi:hypothetical protein